MMHNNETHTSGDSVTYWNKRYISNDTGWDLGEVSPPLKQYIDQLQDKNLRILIPGCGNCHEADYLNRLQFSRVTIIDIAEKPVQELKKRFENDSNISVIHGDFFDLKGEFDLILEQTFFCAIVPEFRKKYVEKMKELLVPGGKLTGVLFGCEFEKAGPPFGGDIPEYKSLFEKDFDISKLELCYNSYYKRDGTELFITMIRK